MSERQEIVFVIRPNGTVEERVTGVAGARCEEITAGVEKALGKLMKRELSSDYFDQKSGESVVVDSRA